LYFGKIGTHVACSQKYPSGQGFTPCLQLISSKPLMSGERIDLIYGTMSKTPKKNTNVPTKPAPITERAIVSIKVLDYYTG
jgi:hypothetical protein